MPNCFMRPCLFGDGKRYVIASYGIQCLDGGVMRFFDSIAFPADVREDDVMGLGGDDAFK